MVKIYNTTEEIQNIQALWKKENHTIGFVPTMGALHAGHLSLVKNASELCSRVVVSIFVNPTQFAPHEDFDLYPKPLERDLELLAGLKVDAVFCPAKETIYPKNFQTYVNNELMSQGLCSGTRPHFFRGVCTVVLKLLMLVKPDIALFGKKDYQQFKLIEQMVSDFHIQTKILACETVREDDGLAMSSRNVYLTAAERQIALKLCQALYFAKKLYQEGERNKKTIEDEAIKILQTHQEIKLDYFEIRNQKDLATPHEIIQDPAVILGAIYLGKTRLIDNVEFSHE